MIKNIIALLLCLFFGAACFLGGILYVNSLKKQDQGIDETKKVNYENKFLEISNKILQNKNLVPQITEGISKIWKQAIEYGSNFTSGIKTYFEKTKDHFKSLKDSKIQKQPPS